MLRHTGHNRSFKHNLRLAVLLCLNAGFINAAGFLAFNVLTTNVTGHAALLALNISVLDMRSVRMILLWLFLFLLGAFFSSLFISLAGRNKFYTYSTLMIIMMIILLFVAASGINYRHTISETELYAGSLLFAMGMQNAMVTMISGSLVRTTHLTGMFTDLGIDLSELLLNYKNTPTGFKRKISLRLSIIFSFLTGGVIGGVSFAAYSFPAFYVPVCFLLLAMSYDFFRIKIARSARHYRKIMTLKRR